MKKMAITLVLIMFFSGCISPTENENSINQEIVNNYNDYHAYQFWNTQPMGVGNMTTFSFDSSIDVFLNVSIYSHENTSTIIKIYSNESVYHYENYTTGQYFIHYYLEDFNNDLHIETLSFGFYNESESLVGDYYLVYIDVDEWA